jgi:NitT/TauT family transport system substrate-binding protein
MRSTAGHRLPVLAVAAALVAAACTAAATPMPTPPPTNAPSASGATPTLAPTAGPTTLPGTKSFTVGFTSPGFSSAPLLAALDALRAQGYTIDTPAINASELLTQGVADGSFAIGAGMGTNTIMAAVAKGATMKVFLARNANETVLYARSATIKSCADLGGKKVAVHSEGSVSYAMIKAYVKANCPQATPNYLIVPGSENRLAAMIADQIDAAPLELGDSITLDAQAGDRFKLLVSFAQDLPQLQPFVFAVNTQFANQNPGTVLALIKAVLTEYRRIAGDAAALQADAEKYVKDAINQSTVAAIARKYTELKMFDVNGGLTAENLQFTADFFGPNGTKAVETALPVNQWADIGFLDTALRELGRK